MKSRLADLKRRLKNARRRAVYWSGRPSFSGFGYSPSNSDHDIQYEAAIDDVNSLCDDIEEMTGTRPKATDPKQKYLDAFSDAMTKRPKTAICSQHTKP